MQGMTPNSVRFGRPARPTGLRLAATLVLCLISISWPAMAAEWFRWGSAVPTATAVRLGGNLVRTRFVADLTVAVNFTAYVIADPYRVVIDLQEVNFEFPAAADRSGRGLVKTFRYGLIDAGRSRIVIDTTGPILIEKAFIVEPENGEPARIVIDLLPTDEKTFAKLQLPRRDIAVSPALDSAPLPLDEEGIPEELPPLSGRSAALSAEAGVSSSPGDPRREHPPAAKKNAGRYTIVIDPGHGGIDPGAVGETGITEKAIVLAFAKELEKRLDGRRYDVILTRTGDTFLSLRDRVRIARRNEADLFLALHADVVRGVPVRGATVYTLSDNASDAEAEALAHEENRADLIAGVDLADENEEITGILIDLAQRETKNHSMVFAKSMVETLKPVIEMTNRPIRSAGFRVLKAPDVPSVLLELGYLSSRTDEKLLNSPAWRAKAASGVARAIDNYFAGRIASTR
jgi:N-acetylmuramoyl-L-alanine amidase